MNLYDKYFTLRNVSAENNWSFQIPPYILHFIPTKSSIIVDIGCGLGNMLLSLRRLGYINLRGIDVSRQSIDHCLTKQLPVTLVNAITDFSLSDNEKADLVIMTHVLEHLPKDMTVETLAHIRHNILKPDGKLFVAVPNGQSNTGGYWMYEDFTHYTLFTTGSLSFVLKAAGFSTVQYIDADGLIGSTSFKRLVRKALLAAYIRNYHFWNKVTNSSFHAPSQPIFTFELKALASNVTRCAHNL